VKESDISREIIKDLRSMGCFAWKNWSGPFSMRGDRIEAARVFRVGRGLDMIKSFQGPSLGWSFPGYLHRETFTVLGKKTWKETIINH